jgi:hypothetical protein
LEDRLEVDSRSMVQKKRKAKTMKKDRKVADLGKTLML